MPDTAEKSRTAADYVAALREEYGFDTDAIVSALFSALEVPKEAQAVLRSWVHDGVRGRLAALAEKEARGARAERGRARAGGNVGTAQAPQPKDRAAPENPLWFLDREVVARDGVFRKFRLHTVADLQWRYGLARHDHQAAGVRMTAMQWSLDELAKHKAPCLDKVPAQKLAADAPPADFRF